ncbi:uncharacterized protein LOC120598644 isoform X1 [Pteropus medius]|uniref:uncharacterized protein LOC120598644 isoform X1 n=1 Tax=Pteropus vampyrus TaxID=132908 RepID=UPI00196A89FB|nr:uncharacterized protein LOC120598644 isoform X1 [Pteropus giganteus]
MGNGCLSPDSLASIFCLSQVLTHPQQWPSPAHSSASRERAAGRTWRRQGGRRAPACVPHPRAPVFPRPAFPGHSWVSAPTWQAAAGRPSPTPQPAGTPLRRAGTLRGKSQSHQRVPTDTKPADPAPQTQVACGGHVTRGRRTHASVDASPTGERETDMSKPRLLSRSGAPCGLALRGPQGPPRSMWLGPGCRHLGSFLPGDSQGL